MNDASVLRKLDRDTSVAESCSLRIVGPGRQELIHFFGENPNALGQELSTVLGFRGNNLQRYARPISGCSTRGTILSMPTDQILFLLIQERDKLNRAIEVLQGPTKRRGRPPKNSLTAATSAASETAQPAKKQRRKFTAAQRAAASERMRQQWAAKKKAEAKSQPKAASKPKKTVKEA
jgi:hypothetical protein